MTDENDSTLPHPLGARYGRHASRARPQPPGVSRCYGCAAHVLTDAATEKKRPRAVLLAV